MLSVVTSSILLLNAISLVRGCSPSCSTEQKHDFDKNQFGLKTCGCTNDDISDCNLAPGPNPGSESEPACRQFCCEVCPQNMGRLLQLESENSTYSNHTASDPVCLCYGAPESGFGDDKPCPEPPVNFEDCSELCNSTCFVQDIGPMQGQEVENCTSSPLFTDEKKSIDKNTAEKYIREWKASGTPGKVCVCKNMGFQIGTNDVAGFQKRNCDVFCSQSDYFGGVGVWLTTDDDELTSPPLSSSPIESTSPPPSSSPIESTSPSSSFSPSCVAFFASVVSVGFLVFS